MHNFDDAHFDALSNLPVDLPFHVLYDIFLFVCSIV